MLRRVSDRVHPGGTPLVNREAMTPFTGVKHDDDATRWHITTKIPMRDARGRVIGVLGINRDINDRKRAELALRESEETFRAVFDQAAVGITVVSRNCAICASTTGFAKCSATRARSYFRSRLPTRSRPRRAGRPSIIAASQAQLAFLAAHGCHQAQGYYFAHPMPAPEFGKFLAGDRRLRAA